MIINQNDLVQHFISCYIIKWFLMLKILNNLQIFVSFTTFFVQLVSKITNIIYIYIIFIYILYINNI